MTVDSDYLLRLPERHDLESLYRFKNDLELTSQLGGAIREMSRTDVDDWLEAHRKQQGELIWIIASQKDDSCVGHVGFYGIEVVNRSAEWGILVGDSSLHGLGLGRKCLDVTVDYGFSVLNLRRIALSVLSTNTRARRLYEGAGFEEEGVRRQAVFRHGQYVDVVEMALLKHS